MLARTCARLSLRAMRVSSTFNVTHASGSSVFGVRLFSSRVQAPISSGFSHGDVYNPEGSAMSPKKVRRRFNEFAHPLGTLNSLLGFVGVRLPEGFLVAPPLHPGSEGASVARALHLQAAFCQEGRR
eukprot:1226130-Rhodomonas_salina.1